MFCPECGQSLPQDAEFCPACGRMVRDVRIVVDQNNRQYTQTTCQVEKSESRFHVPTKAVAVIVVIMIIVAAVVLFNESEEDELGGQSFEITFTDGTAIDSKDYRCATPVAGFTEDDTTIANLVFVKNDRSDTYKLSYVPRLELSQDIQSKYTTYEWSVKVKSSMTPLGPIPPKSEGFITLYSESFEGYLVEVVCTNGSLSKTYSFEFEIEHYMPFQWKYDGGKFTLDARISGKDLYAYTPHTQAEKEARSVKDWRTCTDFVVIDDNVKRIAGSLGTMMRDAFGEDYTRQEYADFILGFVQGGFAYYLDSSLYEQSEYFAYPLETLCYMGGDCEDTSFLCAALYTASGFDSAVVMLPGHAMVGVSLEDYIDYSKDYSSCEVLSLEVCGKTYYAGETTISGQQHVGLSSTDDGNCYSRDLGKGAVGYGSYTFYPVKVLS